MPDKKNIKNVFGSKVSSAYQVIESLCFKFLPGMDNRLLEAEQQRFHKAFHGLDEQIKHFQKNISEISLASFITQWARSLTTDAVYGERYMCQMSELIENGILRLTTDKKHPHTPASFGADEHQEIIGAIRCHIEWTIPKREDMVCFYIEFSRRLSEMTFGYIPIAEDPDRSMSARRKFPFEAYIQLIAELALRERILAKLFYLGGERPLDEILSLEIRNIDFAKKHIIFSAHKVAYPSHVFQDLHEYIQERTKGHVFTGRSGEKINHTVPYRSLKAAGDKLGLDPSFTFKDLVKEL